MIKSNFCISVDNRWDRHISLPWREPNLPDWLQVAHYNPSVLVTIADLWEVLTNHLEWNQKRVNEILKDYY